MFCFGLFALLGELCLPRSVEQGPYRQGTTLLRSTVLVTHLSVVYIGAASIQHIAVASWFLEGSDDRTKVVVVYPRFMHHQASAVRSGT